jgi:hypothetical protein
MGHQIYIRQKDFDSVKYNIKILKCPYCGEYGMLILHGYIYGQNEKRNTVIKGRRVFCSNRNRRKGCGRTIAYRLANFIHQSFLCAKTAWKFLSEILKGSSIENAYNSLDTSFTISISTLYFFWKKFRHKTDAIRTTLSNHFKLCPSDANCPYRETIFHLKEIFKNINSNPIESYQRQFQRCFV